MKKIGTRVHVVVSCVHSVLKELMGYVLTAEENMIQMHKKELVLNLNQFLHKDQSLK